MIRLGHIVYSNCFPVHALLVQGAPPTHVQVVRGVPSELNELLAAGRIDVAPCSSIEYARHQSEYRLLPDLAIASHGPVQSILLETTVAVEELDGRDVLVPTASATSVVLLRILLELCLGVRARMQWFEQGTAPDPIAGGVAAALWIGDVALRRTRPHGRSMIDLGEMWTRWTGLPFVYALWQARADADAAALHQLHALLLESRAYFRRNAQALAQSQALQFRMPAERLAQYWDSLRYELDDAAGRGLLLFFQFAASLDEAPVLDSLRFI